MTDIKEIEQLLDEINDSANELWSRKKEIKQSDLPSNIRLMFTGVKNTKALDYLFSARLDELLEKLLDLAMSGDLLMNAEKYLTSEEEVKKLFDSLGFGEGSFEGPVSKTVLGTIRKSMESEKYRKLSNDAKKVKLLYRQLSLKRWSFIGKPELKKQYDKAFFAIKKILLTIANVYKNRVRIVNGLSAIINESVNVPIEIVPIMEG